MFNKTNRTMNKKLELTPEQKELVAKYRELCREMKLANIKAVYRVDELYFINGTNVSEINFADYIDPENGENVEKIKFDELTCYDYPYDFAVGVKDEGSFEVAIS